MYCRTFLKIKVVALPLHSTAGMGNLLATSHIDCGILLAGPKNEFISCWNLTFIFPSERRHDYGQEQETLLLTYCQRVWLSWSFVLTYCSVLTWITKILMQATLNVHAGRRLPPLLYKKYQNIHLPHFPQCFHSDLCHYGLPDATTLFFYRLPDKVWENTPSTV